jgi:neutral ceramidase
MLDSITRVAALAIIGCVIQSPLFAEVAHERLALKVGFAERDISPRLGMERPGNYYKQFHVDFHDPCKVRAAVFANDELAVAVVSVDALVVCRPQVEKARKLIHEKTGIAPSSVLIAATHSHSSGPTGMILHGDFDHADDFIRKLAYEESTVGEPEYLHHLVTQIVDAVVSAHSSLVPAKVGVGRGSVEGVTFNRRFHMRSGLIHTMPRPGNPDIIKPAGPTDPDLSVIGVWSSDGSLIGCVLNFSCHATTARNAISANYVYYLEKQLRAALGDDIVVVFLAGASGDINTTDNQSPYKRVAGETAGILIGSQLGAEAIKQLLLMGATSQMTLASDSREVSIPRRIPSPSRIAAAELIVKDPKQPKNTAGWIFAKETLLAASLAKHAPESQVEVQVVQIGPAVLVSSPAEYFCQFGLDQKQAIHFPFTFPVSLANGCVGYVPTEDSFGKNGGGYETRLTSYSNLIPSAGKLIADLGIELANQLKPGPIPEPDLAEPFKEAWQYGSVPPETE